MSKYTDMMREQEYVGYRLAEHGQGSSTRAHGDKCATDWRAMREAWEAMVEACEEALIEIGYSMNPSGIVIDKLDTALAKARGE